MTYYIFRGGQQHGPYSMADLQNMLAAGLIEPNDLVWGEGMAAWTPVSQVVTAAAGPTPVFAQPEPAVQPQPASKPEPATKLQLPAQAQPAAQSEPTVQTPDATAQTPAYVPSQALCSQPSQAPYSQPAQADYSMAPSGVPSGNVRSQNVVTRYKTGYRVAGVIVALGTIVKVAGIVLGVIYALALAVAAMIGGGSVPSMGISGGGAGIVAVIVGIVGGALVWLIFWLYGTLISAGGWVLRAVLDGAVHSSPFLSDDQRADAMGV